MKRTIIISALIVALSISVLSQKSDKKLDKTGRAKEQVTALATELANALIKGDTAVLERILSDDYADIGPNGFPTTKKMLIDYFKINANNAGVPKLAALDLGNSFVRIYGDTAVMTVPVSAKWRGPDNQTGEQNYLATLVAVKKNGDWQFVAGHYSEIKTQQTQP